MCACFAFGEATEEATAAAVDAMARVVHCANAEIAEHLATTVAKAASKSVFGDSKRADWDNTNASVCECASPLLFGPLASVPRALPFLFR